jgi:hypothetical protein
MFISYQKEKGGEHYVCVRNKGYRKRLLDKGWYLKGGYAERVTSYGSIIQKIVLEYDCLLVCSFQFKNYMWANMEKEA